MLGSAPSIESLYAVEPDVNQSQDQKPEGHATKEGNRLFDMRSQEDPLHDIMPVQYLEFYAELVAILELLGVEDWAVSCSVAKVGKGKHGVESNDLDIFTTRDAVFQIFHFFSGSKGKTILEKYGLSLGREEVDIYGESTRLAVAGEYNGLPVDIEIFGEGDKTESGGTVQMGGPRQVDIYQHWLRYSDSKGRQREVLYQDVSQRELAHQYIRVTLRELMVAYKEFTAWLHDSGVTTALESFAKKIPSRFQSLLQLYDKPDRLQPDSVKKEFVVALRELALVDTKEDVLQYSLPKELVQFAKTFVYNMLEKEGTEKIDSSNIVSLGGQKVVDSVMKTPIKTGELKVLFHTYLEDVKQVWLASDHEKIAQKNEELKTLVSSLPPLYGMFFQFLYHLNSQVLEKRLRHKQ